MTKFSGKAAFLVSAACVGVLGTLLSSARADELNAEYASGHAATKLRTACIDQVWPNIDPTCAATGQPVDRATRQVRVISLDRGSPNVVAAPPVAANRGNVAGLQVLPAGLAAARKAAAGADVVEKAAEPITMVRSDDVPAPSDREAVADIGVTAEPAVEPATQTEQAKPARSLIEGRKLARAKAERAARRQRREDVARDEFGMPPRGVVYRDQYGRDVVVSSDYAGQRRRWYGPAQEAQPPSDLGSFFGRLAGGGF